MASDAAAAFCARLAEINPVATELEPSDVSPLVFAQAVSTWLTEADQARGVYLPSDMQPLYDEAAAPQWLGAAQRLMLLGQFAADVFAALPPGAGWVTRQAEQIEDPVTVGRAAADFLHLWATDQPAVMAAARSLFRD